MIPSFYHEEVVKVGDDTLRLSLTFLALDAIERETGRPFDGILRDLTGGSEDAANALTSRVVWGLLRDHHSEIDINQAAWLVNDPAASVGIGVAMGKLFDVAFPRAAPADGKAKAAHPRKPRGASKNTSSHGAVSA